LECANQANLRAHTEELTEGRLLEFTLDLPSDTSKEIGFFFTVNQHTFTTGVLHLSALEEGTLLEDKSFPLKDLTEDQKQRLDDYIDSMTWSAAIWEKLAYQQGMKDFLSLLISLS